MGIKLYVNNEQVWESEGDATLVSYISGSTKRGEFGRLGVANDIDRVDLFIGVRDEIENASDLDVRDALEGRERSEKLEKALKDRGDRSNGNDVNRIANESLEKSRGNLKDDGSEDNEPEVNTSTSPVDTKASVAAKRR